MVWSGRVTESLMANLLCVTGSLLVPFAVQALLLWLWNQFALSHGPDPIESTFVNFLYGEWGWRR